MLKEFIQARSQHGLSTSVECVLGLLISKSNSLLYRSKSGFVADQLHISVLIRCCVDRKHHPHVFALSAVVHTFVEQTQTRRPRVATHLTKRVSTLGRRVCVCSTKV